MCTKGLLLRDRDGTSYLKKKKKWKETNQLVSQFSQLFSSSWMVPIFIPRVGGPVQGGREGRWEIPQTGLSITLDLCRECLGSHIDRQWPVSLCSTLQLDGLTWWSRHKKAPAIILHNSSSEAAEITPEDREKDLVETAASDNEEEAGRVNKHTPVPGSAQPGSHANP